MLHSGSKFIKLATFATLMIGLWSVNSSVLFAGGAGGDDELSQEARDIMLVHELVPSQVLRTLKAAYAAGKLPKTGEGEQFTWNWDNIVTALNCPMTLNKGAWALVNLLRYDYYEKKGQKTDFASAYLSFMEYAVRFNTFQKVPVNSSVPIGSPSIMGPSSTDSWL